MGAAGGRESPALIQQLLSQPYRFDFFQAVRILERAAGENCAPAAAQNKGANQPVGHDHAPSREAARFRATPSLGFPPGSIVDIRVASTDGQEKKSGGAGVSGGGGGSAIETHNGRSSAHMTVSFMGLTGPSGVLPVHYTRMVIDRIREKDYSIRDFFDLFNHRLISLFYRAWEKYRFPTGYERSRLGTGAGGAAASSVAQAPHSQRDLFTSCLYCLTGLGTSGLQKRMKVDDESFLLYSGFFANAHRPAVALERTLADYFELPARVEQFQGQWLNLGPDDLSRLPGGEHPKGLNHKLGVTTVLGDRVWDVQSRFRVRLGPLTYEQYCRFTPNGNGLEPMCQMVTTFAGPEFDFDVQPILKAAEVPGTRIGAAMEVKPMLGWNVWLKSREFERDFAEAAFSLMG